MTYVPYTCQTPFSHNVHELTSFVSQTQGDQELKEINYEFNIEQLNLQKHGLCLFFYLLVEQLRINVIPLRYKEEKFPVFQEYQSSNVQM